MSLSLNSHTPKLIQRCSDLQVPSHVHAAATFKFKVGDRVSAKYKKCHYKWPGEIFNRHAAEDGTATYSVSFDLLRTYPSLE